MKVKKIKKILDIWGGRKECAGYPLDEPITRS